MDERAVTVSQLNRYVKSLLEKDAALSRILVTGEISNFKPHPSGHLYFALKDDESQVSCVMFKGQASGLRFRPENGQKVIVRAKASLFERSGGFQLYISEMDVLGVGALHLAFEQLKQRLEKEGLFKPERKRPLPLLPRRVGVVTSPSGAVIRDILHVLGRRYPNFRLILYPVAVQGPGAARSIADAIRRMNEAGLADVLIVGRGGGSMEDLWAFNEEIVARAVHDSRIPVVSAVGHETDFTICDFAADYRAPTPSAAAEVVMPRKADMAERLDEYRNRMRRGIVHKVDTARRRLERAAGSRILQDPAELVNRRQMSVDLLGQRLLTAQQSRIAGVSRRLSMVCGKLDALSPLKVLARGYGMVTDRATGRSVLSVRQTSPGQFLSVTLADGSLGCRVEEIEAASERMG
ncbi:MAG: exodeoxyribonuclease VII large subunit [Clostridia bacterium]|nr:exodeoxyribonuclease VII large subunit [Clostridia bacterium]